MATTSRRFALEETALAALVRVPPRPSQPGGDGRQFPSHALCSSWLSTPTAKRSRRFASLVTAAIAVRFTHTSERLTAVSSIAAPRSANPLLARSRRSLPLAQFVRSFLHPTAPGCSASAAPPVTLLGPLHHQPVARIW